MYQLTQDVIDSFSKIENERQKYLITTLAAKLHEYIEDVQLSQNEWEMAIDFLTRTGQMCHGQRQEYILLSDVMGVSMLVDEINHHQHEKQTPSTVFGPFFIPEMPVRDYGASIVEHADMEAEQLPLLITGQVVDPDLNPIKNAKIEIWQTAENGMYSGQDAAQQLGNLRGIFYSQAQGEYAIQSIIPVSYQIPSDGPVGELLNFSKRHFWRPAHIHFMITAENYHRLVTHLFLKDDPYLESDTVFGVKDALVVDYQRCEYSAEIEQKFNIHSAYYKVDYQFVLAKEQA
ncbi:dioxygenase [Acinetobacter sp. 226-4]|uniref:dioxygenase family protein n=1 Tax=Acinetobacter sp. 226-4 TaxID=2746719 RepID=UPI0025780412|nr:dioxygenase [Acinetobacter sp. 226-4]MDM1769690.1 6-chlorohydroxyquinol-1,2-dioxygenase [Acinetobacter sp. 226-4]